MNTEEVKAMLKVNRETGFAKQTIENCCTVLEYDDTFTGRVRYNTLNHQTELSGKMPWDRIDRRLDDVDMDHIKLHFEKNYGITSEKCIYSAISITGMKYRHNPIQDALNCLIWDGTDRYRDAMAIYLGAERSDVNAEFLKVFMLGAVNRVFHPGCKFEMMLSLTGDQGVGKSSFLRLLALKDEWFCDDISNISDDNVCRYLMGHWIIELAELVATSNSKSIEATKAQISRMKDTYKIPYDRYAHDFPRQCVFAGTTNRHEFLPPDKTGNRRFLPVECSLERREKMILENEKESRRYLAQLWAQTMYIFRHENPELKLSPETEKYLSKYQEGFTPEDNDEGVLIAWFEDTEYDEVCTMMLYRECLDGTGTPQQYILNGISETVNQLIKKGKIKNFRRAGNVRRISRYGVQRCWERI